MIFNQLTKKDQELITNYIENYAFYEVWGQSIKAPLSHILRYWEESKEKHLYKMFGNELILSKDIHYQASEEDLVEIMTEKIGYNSDCAFLQNFYNEVICKISIHRDKYFYYDEDFQSLADISSLVKNVYNGATREIKIPDSDKTIKIQHGCKLSKVIGKLAEAFNVEGYEEFRIRHSQVLNGKLFKGKLSISIHPMDYMTMSDNDCDWSSCMSWQSCGDYRQGTVEMMNSPYVVVAYLRSENSMDNGWNSKKWRELFIVDENFITSVKGYPYHQPNLEKEVVLWLKELAEKNLGWEFYDDIAYYHHCKEFTFNDSTYSFSFTTDMMYNDFSNNCYGQTAVIGKDCPCSCSVHRFNYSGISECMCCGEAIPAIRSEQFLVCNNCEEVHYCAECGEIIRDGDDYYEHNGNYYCDYCYDHMVTECSNCGEEFFDVDGENLRRIYVGEIREEEGEKTFHYELYDSIQLCKKCFENYKDFIKEFHIRWYGSTLFVIKNESLKELLDLFYEGSLTNFTEEIKID